MARSPATGAVRPAPSAVPPVPATGAVRPAPSAVPPVPATGAVRPAPSAVPPAHGRVTNAGRWELLRALGAMVSSPPPLCHPVAAALGLPAPSATEHTSVFVLSAPPHAAIYLGADGMLGGEGLDRVAGFWRALGLTAAGDADHLGALLALYAGLGEAETAAHSERARTQIQRAREALLWEHLWSWAPAYLTAVRRLGTPSLARWAAITLRALTREAECAVPPAALPLALRAAPPAPWAEGADGAASEPGDDLLPAVLLAPVRSGVVITSGDLRQAAASAGLGYRLGERRYTLQAMLDQDVVATVGWLRVFAAKWVRWHARRHLAGPDPGRWWADRARGTAAALSTLEARLARAG